MILVTGGAGFLGRRVVRALAERGVPRIRCLVRPGADVSAVPTDFPACAVEFVMASFNDSAGLRKAFDGVEVVYHVAAAKRGSAPALVADTVVGSDNVLQAAQSANVARFVLVSSLGVVDAAGLPIGGVVDESVPLDPHPEWRDAYTFSKHRQETLAWEYAGRGLPLVVVRPGVIFGPGEPLLHTRVGLRVPGMFLQLGRPNAIPLTYVDNCADAVVLAGLKPDLRNAVVCVVDDDLPLGRQILRRYRREIERLRVVTVPYSVMRQLARVNVWYHERTQGHFPVLCTPYEVASIWKRLRYVNRAAKERLGWGPRVDMQTALDKTFRALADAQHRS
jgi:nucleoside-diphosphate-sugar epimerase